MCTAETTPGGDKTSGQRRMFSANAAQKQRSLPRAQEANVGDTRKVGVGKNMYAGVVGWWLDRAIGFIWAEM